MATDVSTIQTSSAAVYGDRSHAASQNREQNQTVSQGVSQVSSQASSQADLEQALSQLREFSQSMHRSLDFSVDSESGRAVVRVMDSQTDEVIRQIPTEEAINIARNIERIKGILFEDQV